MNDISYMGESVRKYQSRVNVNTFIHGFYRSRQLVTPSAIITREKQYPDVSFYQGVIEWPVMRSQTDTVIIRAGQNEWVDEQFFVNWSEAKRLGMKRGVYWFYDGRKSPGAQAELFSTLIRNDPPEMEVITDWERNYSGAHEGLPNVVAFMQRLETIMPTIRSMMYTGYYWFTENSNPITHATQYQYLRSRNLHLAWYGNDPSVVRIPAPWSDLLLWQYGTPAVGTQYGCESVELDMNFFNGTEQEFYSRYGGDVPPSNGGEMQYGKINTGVLNVRAGPGASYTDIGNLMQNDYVIAGEVVGGWWRLTKANRGGWNGAPIALANGVLIETVSNAWCSGSYILPVDPPAPAPSGDIAIDMTLRADGTITGSWTDA